MFRKLGLGSVQVQQTVPRILIYLSCLTLPGHSLVRHTHTMSSENLESDTQVEYEDEKQVGFRLLSWCCWLTTVHASKKWLTSASRSEVFAIRSALHQSRRRLKKDAQRFYTLFIRLESVCTVTGPPYRPSCMCVILCCFLVYSRPGLIGLSWGIRGRFVAGRPPPNKYTS